MVNFFRTSDTSYVGYVSPAQGVLDVEVSVAFDGDSDDLIKPQQRRKLVNQLFAKLHPEELQGICSGFKTVNFRADGRNFVLTPQNNIVLRIVSWVCRFFKIIKNDSKVDYSITTSYTPALFYTPKLKLDMPDSPPITIEGFMQKLSRSNAYFDPFTELATTLFQDYEPYHSWKDVRSHPRRDASQYQLVAEGDNLTGKLIDDETVSAEQKAACIRAYRAFIEKQFGKHVIDRIQTHYDFSFDNMIAEGEPLTPEIVYRINVGTSYVVIGDIERLVWDLKDARELPERIQQRAKNLRVAVDALDIKNPDHFAKLMDLFLLSEYEYEKIFTGRALHGIIKSWYTQGDDELFKPWIDQQEFSQTCFKIPRRTKDKAWDCFYEDLAMILCKKHLHQKDPDGTYRVGAIIPAPKQEDKPQAYYKVTSLLYNSRGILSYSLEPACPNTALPVIKLYRSTAVSPYNFDGFASLKNDFNPINSPGYEGSHLLERHELEFFKRRTIPVWVGYQHLASKKRQLTRESMQEVYTLLTKANTTLIAEINAKYAKPTLKQFIRKYDSEFMDLIQNYPKHWLTGYYKAWYLLNNCLRHAVKYDYDEQSSRVQYLKAFLDEAVLLEPITEQDKKLVALAKKLLTWWNWDAKVADKKSKEANRAEDQRASQLIENLKRHQEDALITRLGTSQSFTETELRLLWEKLKKWNLELAKYAIEKNEDIERKENQNIDFVGHSLGAACAERFLVYYTASKGRIPVPGQTISARIFDDPAINDEDNQAFIDFGNEHADLLTALHAKYAIIRRQEAGDVVPQTGETHLGAMKTPELRDKSVRWLKFDAAVQKASSKANHPYVRDTVTAHGRMFADAKRKIGTKEIRQEKKQKVKALTNLGARTPAQEAQLKSLQQELAGDYKSTKYDAYRQWEFDHPPNGKIWRELYTLWHLPLPSIVDSLVLERMRSYFSAAFRSGFFLNVIPKIMRTFAQLAYDNPQGDENHGPWRQNCNAKGVLVVTDMA